MRLPSAIVVSAVAVVAVAFWSPAVRAQECNRPDVEATVPPDGAVDVPPNAMLSALYVRSAHYADEMVELTQTGIGDARFFVEPFNAAEGILTITPDELVPGEEYRVTWPQLRGIASASKGMGAEATFVVGDVEDTEAPSFDGIERVRWKVKRSRDDCTDSVEERFAFDFDLGAATDDGGRENLVLTIFQTSGPAVGDGAPEPVLVGTFPEEGDRVRVTRTFRDAVGTVCFAALVRDLTQRVSNSADQEVCVHTTRPPFFESCAVRRGPRGARRELPAALAFGLLAAIGAARRRRYRG